MYSYGPETAGYAFIKVLNKQIILIGTWLSHYLLMGSSLPLVQVECMNREQIFWAENTQWGKICNSLPSIEMTLAEVQSNASSSVLWNKWQWNDKNCEMVPWSCDNSSNPVFPKHPRLKAAEYQIVSLEFILLEIFNYFFLIC